MNMEPIVTVDPNTRLETGHELQVIGKIFDTELDRPDFISLREAQDTGMRGRELVTFFDLKSRISNHALRKKFSDEEIKPTSVFYNKQGCYESLLGLYREFEGDVDAMDLVVSEIIDGREVDEDDDVRIQQAKRVVDDWEVEEDTYVGPPCGNDDDWDI